jgi:hypothetical protein
MNEEEGQDCDYGKQKINSTQNEGQEFYLLFAVVKILSFVPHSLLTHLLLSV